MPEVRLRTRARAPIHSEEAKGLGRPFILQAKMQGWGGPGTGPFCLQLPVRTRSFWAPGSPGSPERARSYIFRPLRGSLWGRGPGHPPWSGLNNIKWADRTTGWDRACFLSFFQAKCSSAWSRRVPAGRFGV